MTVCVAVCRIPYGQLKEKGVNFRLTACEEKEYKKNRQRKGKIRCCGKIDTSWLHVKHLDEFIDKFL